MAENKIGIIGHVDAGRPIAITEILKEAKSTVLIIQEEETPVIAPKPFVIKDIGINNMPILTVAKDYVNNNYITGKKLPKRKKRKQ